MLLKVVAGWLVEKNTRVKKNITGNRKFNNKYDDRRSIEGRIPNH
ncbi:MAG: hypothetical protein JWM28_1205 [Chitinophagaceae bacterium]|nr:hypothetical protein [Chitinophagaceae bacterium]